MTLASLKISYLEQLNSKIFALLTNSFTCLKIDRLIRRIGISDLHSQCSGCILEFLQLNLHR